MEDHVRVTIPYPPPCPAGCNLGFDAQLLQDGRGQGGVDVAVGPNVGTGRLGQLPDRLDQAGEVRRRLSFGFEFHLNVSRR